MLSGGGGGTGRVGDGVVVVLESDSEGRVDEIVLSKVWLYRTRVDIHTILNLPCLVRCTKGQFLSGGEPELAILVGAKID